MKFEVLQKAMIEAMKARDSERKEAISTMVSAAKKLAIDAGCRENIPEEMVDKAILSEVKQAEEQVATCPDSRPELKAQYELRLNVMKEFAPKMLSAEEVKAVITEKFADVIATKNKGAIMKAVMPELKGKADGKVINQVITELMQ